MTTKLEQSLHFWLGGGYAPAMRTPLQTRSESSADRMLAATLALLAEEGQAASTAFTHRLAGTVAQWVQQRFDCGVPAAQAAWRILFALGASRALFDDDAISATPLSPGALADALGRAVLAVVR